MENGWLLIHQGYVREGLVDILEMLLLVLFILKEEISLNMVQRLFIHVMKGIS